MNGLPDRPKPPSHRLRRVPLAGLILAAAALMALAASGWSVEIDGESHAIRSRMMEGTLYLSASDLATAFGGWLREDRERGNFQLEVAGTRMVLSAHEGLASIDGRLVTLPQPNRVAGGELWVVPELVDKAISPVFPRTVERAGTGFRVRGAVPVEVTLRSRQDPKGTRCVLEFSRAVRYEVASAPGGVSVRVLDGPLRTERVPWRVPGDEVAAVRFEPTAGGVGGTFSFERGPTFRGVTDSRLRDPFRIVLDFDRDASAVAAAPAPGVPLLPGNVPEAARGIRRIVIDPGHGGTETGAQGPTGLFEKEVVLDIARRLTQRLRRQGGLEVVLTRDTDKQLPLDDRAGLANHEKGDLFVSIHANASRGARASGAETYFLSYEATDDLAVELAAAENTEGGTAPSPSADGIDRVLWDMAQKEYQRESSLLAESIQRDLNELLGTRDRGVRQAPFRVLMGVQMPAVLVEVAFISNPQEEESLKTSEFRDRIAEALAGSITRYKQAYEQRTGVAEAAGGASRSGS